LQKERHIDQWDREDKNIPIKMIFDKMFFDKDAKAIQKESMMCLKIALV
jgi:hypothetical protein